MILLLLSAMVPVSMAQTPDPIEGYLDTIERDFGTAMARDGDTIGGDDVTAVNYRYFRHSDMDIAENGDIYIAVEMFNSVSGLHIWVYRSTDGGDTFTAWGYRSDSDQDQDYSQPSLEISEGIENRLYLAYRHRNDTESWIGVCYAELGTDIAGWSAEGIALSSPGGNFKDPELCSDVDNNYFYRLFVVATGATDIGADIWYAFNGDRALGWEPGYVIGSLNYFDRYYGKPDITYGYGSTIHVVWEYGLFDDTYDSAIRYRRCPMPGYGGISTWDDIQHITSTSSGFYEKAPQVVAAWASEDVSIICQRSILLESGSHFTQDPGVISSTNLGVSFGSLSVIPDGISYMTDARLQPDTYQLTVIGQEQQRLCLHQAPIANPTAWSTRQVFSDADDQTGTVWGAGVAFDPTHDNRPAVAWSTATGGGDYGDMLFDAQWRSDPGYPNITDGFPVTFTGVARSAPVVVDLDGDSDLEILFTDSYFTIHAIHHDGTAVAGWPVDVGAPLSTDGPVAVGDLVGQGNMCVVAGTRLGSVVCYTADGILMDGFPRLIQQDKNAYVSIGNLGGFYKGTIVAACGKRLEFLNFHGNNVTGSYSYEHATSEITYPAAIGDIDDNGVNEVVFAAGRYLIAKRMTDLGTVLYSHFAAGGISDAPTLADMDQDGDLEIAVPLSTGYMYVVNHDAQVVSGFPTYSGANAPVSSGAWAQMWGTWDLELVYAVENNTVDAYTLGGVQLPGYPVTGEADSEMHGSPIIAEIGDSGPAAVVGSRDTNIWAWTNLGALIPGWPKDFSHWVDQTLAAGDLDLDGFAELVVIDGNKLFVLDINTPMANAYNSWPMEGHNPQRTGCYNCPSFFPVNVEDDAPTITQVSFAAPSPNPTSGPTQFSFSVPVRAVVQLDVFDIRGHRIRTVNRAEMQAGRHVMSWDGQGESGMRLASGVYFARLTVRGPELDQTLTRKINLVR